MSGRDAIGSARRVRRGLPHGGRTRPARPGVADLGRGAGGAGGCLGGRAGGDPTAAGPQRVGARRAAALRGLRPAPRPAPHPGRLHRPDARAWACRSDPRPDYGVAVSDHGSLGCDLDPQLQVFIAGRAGPATQGCALWRGLWPFLAARERPQVVALGLGRWEVADHLLDGQWVHIGEPAWDQHLTADLESAVAIFHSIGARVVLFTMPYVDPSDRQPDGMPWSENAPARAQAYNALVRQVAQADPGEVTRDRPQPDAQPRRRLHGVSRRGRRALARRRPHQRGRRSAVAARDPARRSTTSAWRTRRRPGRGGDRPRGGGVAAGRGRRRVRPGGDVARAQCGRPQPRRGARCSTPRRARASSRCGRGCSRRARWPLPASSPTGPVSSSPSPWRASSRPTATGSSTS